MSFPILNPSADKTLIVFAKPRTPPILPAPKDNAAVCPQSDGVEKGRHVVFFIYIFIVCFYMETDPTNSVVV